MIKKIKFLLNKRIIKKEFFDNHKSVDQSTIIKKEIWINSKTNEIYDVEFMPPDYKTIHYKKWAEESYQWFIGSIDILENNGFEKCPSKYDRALSDCANAIEKISEELNPIEKLNKKTAGFRRSEPGNLNGWNKEKSHLLNGIIKKIFSKSIYLIMIICAVLALILFVLTNMFFNIRE